MRIAWRREEQLEISQRPRWPSVRIPTAPPRSPPSSYVCGPSHAEWTPVHSSSCGVLFRLCETLCIETGAFCVAVNAWPSRAQSRVELRFLGAPSDLTTQDRSGAATSKKQRSVYLARWSHSCSRRVAGFVVRVANLRCDACHFARNSPSSHVIFLSNHDLGRTTSTGLIEWRSP